MAFLRQRRNLLWLLVSWLWVSPAAARFQLEDADRIDTEERLGTETYNDRLSYRYPLPWDDIWDEHQSGYRANAGSLTVSRFDYGEDIKLHAAGDEHVSLSFAQARREDMVESRQERTLSLALDLDPGVQIAALGDCGSYKEYGDLGLALGLAPRRGTLPGIKVYYWAVDAYYASKKTDPADTRSRAPGTWGAEVTYLFQDSGQVLLTYEEDRSFTWQRASRGYEYHYSAARSTAKLSWGAMSSRRLILNLAWERKAESKAWSGSSEARRSSKSMERQVAVSDFFLAEPMAAGTLRAGVWTIARDARYGYFAGPDLDEAEWVERPGPPSSRRREAALYGTLHRLGWGTRHFFETGAVLNHVLIDEAQEQVATELKWILAWDYVLSARARALLGSTWDLDQLAADFPYRRHPFRPWGGGYLQVMATL